MTLRHDMIQTLAKAPIHLNEATDTIRGYVLGLQGPDGGFRGRDAESDLYYSVFALELILALECPLAIDDLQNYLKTFDHGQTLDLVHLASLARCWANLADVTGWPIETQLQEGMTQRLLELQCQDGGFSTQATAEQGNAYGCFLALAMCQDLKIALLEPECILQCLTSLKLDDGGLANDTESTAGTTPSTAAGLCVYHMFDRTLPEESVFWLQQRIHAQGGFSAIAGDGPLCLPDLLSTATALHALSYSLLDTPQPRERHLDFLDSVWNPQGGFCGSWADPTVDCEYTYYGLLALGHLVDLA